MQTFLPKYQMTVAENIYAAKRNIIDYIWKSARLEGLGVTYPDTEAIFNGVKAPGIKVDEIIAVNNLKHAWQFVLETVDVPLSLGYISEVNRKIGGDNLFYEAGMLRKIPVRIGGTDWQPEIPFEADIKRDMSQIMENPDDIDRGITMMLYLMRRQMFIDGNKRTSMMIGNKIFIESGNGVISVPIQEQPIFTEMLVEFYETNDMGKIKQFVYDKCIDGIDFAAQRKLTVAEQCKEKELLEPSNGQEIER